MIDYSDIEKTNIEELASLKNTNLQAKEEFYREKSLPVPRFEYGELDGERAGRNIALIGELRKELAETPMDETERLLFEMSLDFNNKKNRIVKTCADYHQGDKKEKERLLALYKNAVDDMYKQPQREVFYHLLALQKGETDAIDSKYIYNPTKEVFKRFSSKVMDFYKGMLSKIPQDKESFTIEEAGLIAQRIIEEDFGAPAGWKAVVSPDSPTASVNHLKKEVRFPALRPAGDYSRKALKAILVHEVGVHLRRALPYYSVANHPLGRGLYGYEECEEGIAKALEQAVNGEFEQSGWRHYTGVGLATFKGMNFREVFETQVKLSEDRSKPTIDACYNSTVRVFRGTGLVVHQKDLAYFNGANSVWRHISENIDSPELISSLLDSGKTDIFNKEHMKIMRDFKSKHPISI